MSATVMRGRARRLGDDVDTDTLIQSRRKRETLDPQELRRYLLESHDPAFAASVRPGDVLVAGRNFGCGSAMEVAATVVLGAGIRAVVAESFSRTYFRNAINNGLVPVTCDTGGIGEGAELEIVLDAPPVVRILESGQERPAQPLPPIMLAILEAGGLVPYFRRHGDFLMPA